MKNYFIYIPKMLISGVNSNNAFSNKTNIPLTNTQNANMVKKNINLYSLTGIQIKLIT